MANNRLYQFKQKLDHAFAITSTIIDDEEKAILTKHLCIMVAGYVENILKATITTYASKHSSREMQNYIESSTKSITNLNKEKITSCLNQFDVTWGKDFEQKISSEQCDALATILANRNQIAHGKDVGMTFVNIEKYYKCILQVERLIDKIVNSKK